MQEITRSSQVPVETITIERDGKQRKVLRGIAAVYFDGSAGTEYRLYGNVYERIAPGAFDEVLSQNPDVRLSVNHDARETVARTPSLPTQEGTISEDKDMPTVWFQRETDNTETLFYTVQREQTMADGTEGGYFKDDSTYSGLNRNLKAFGGVRRVARVLPTPTGNVLHFVCGDDTSNSCGIQGTTNVENQTISNTSVAYTRKQIADFTFVTAAYPVSFQLLQDAPEIANDVGSVLGIRLGRGTAAKYAKGTGTNEPEGWTAAGTAAVAAASASVVTYPELVNLYHSLDVAYRDDPSCAFVMHDLTLAMLRKIVDGASRPLIWSANDSATGAFREMLFGKPIVIDNSMDSVGASKIVIGFGAWDNFIVRDVNPGAQIMVLRERYAEQLSIAYVGWLRTDCKLLNAKAVQMLTMHA